MTTPRRARVVRASELGEAKSLMETPPAESVSRPWTRVTREELQARESAQRILREASERAEEILKGRT